MNLWGRGRLGDLKRPCVTLREEREREQGSVSESRERRE